MVTWSHSALFSEFQGLQMPLGLITEHLFYLTHLFLRTSVKGHGLQILSNHLQALVPVP